MLAQDSIWRDKTWWKMLGCIALFSSIAIILLQILVINPAHDYIQAKIANDNAKSKAEHDEIKIMSCEQLRQWLLTDSWFDRDNLIFGQNTYMVNCK